MADHTGIEVPTTVKAGVALVAVAMGMTIVSNAITQAAKGSPLMAGLAVVFGIALGVFFLYKLYTGRNWMRVLLSVFAVIATVFMLFTLGTRFAGTNWIDTIAVIVEVVGLVLLWLKPSNEFFYIVKYGRPSGRPKIEPFASPE